MERTGRLAAQDPEAAAAAAAAAAFALPRNIDTSRNTEASSSSAITLPDASQMQRGKIIYANVPRGQASAIAYIKYASLDKLIEKLTDDKESDFVFKNAFVLCYRAFATPAQVAQGLIERFSAVSAESKTGRPLPAAVVARNSVLQLKVLSMMSFWMKKDFTRGDIMGDPEAQEVLTTFFNHVLEGYGSGQRNIATSLLDLMSQWRAERSEQSELDRKSTEFDLSQLDISDSKSGALSPTSQTQLSKVKVQVDQSGFVTMDGDPMAAAAGDLDTAHMDKDRGRSGQFSVTSSVSPGDFQLSTSASSDGDYVLGEAGDMQRLRISGEAREASMNSETTTASLSALSSLQSLQGSPPPDKKVRAGSSGSSKASTTSSNPKLNKSSHKLKPLLGLPAEHVAEVLTLSEMEQYYARIQPREFTNKAWTREETKRKEARHIVRMIELFNARANWVASEVLHPKLETSDRAKVISFFIDVAETCRRLNNFNTLFEVVNGLKNPCLAQLHNTWTLVHQSRLERFAVLQQLISSDNNYTQYRQAVALCDGQPCVPCLAVATKDVFGLEEGMPSLEHGLIHFAKFRKVYEAISSFLSYQEHAYAVIGKGDDRKRVASTRGDNGKSMTLRADDKLLKLLKTRMKYFQKSQVDLWRLAKHANTQESITFVNSISEAGFL